MPRAHSLVSRARARLTSEFAAHLRAEEEQIFPLLGALLTPSEQDAIMKELRARRAPPLRVE